MQAIQGFDVEYGSSNDSLALQFYLDVGYNMALIFYKIIHNPIISAINFSACSSYSQINVSWGVQDEKFGCKLFHSLLHL